MKAKQFIRGVSVATILVLASPVYAVNLGGGAIGGFGGTLGGFGGGVAGGLGSGAGGLRTAGGLASQGAINDSLDVKRTHAVDHAADKVESKAGMATQAAGTATQAAADAEGAASANAGKDSASLGSTLQGQAAKTAAPAPAPAKSTSTAPTNPAAPSAPPRRTHEAASFAGTGDGAASVGNRSVSGSGDGSLGVEHSPHSNSLAAGGAASASSSAN
jgi:hypothetical protein